MPMRKSYSRSRPRATTSRRRSTPWYNRKYSTMQLARQAFQGVKYLKGLVNSERMYLDTALSYNILNTGQVYSLSGITQGDLPSNRTGNSVLVRSLNYRYYLEINPNVVNNTRITILIVKDLQQVGDTNPTWANLMSTTTPESLLSTATAGRFQVLERKTHVLTPVEGGTPAKEVSGYLNIQSHVRYNGASATDIQKGGYYMMFISSEATNYPTITGTVRLGFHDN